MVIFGIFDQRLPKGQYQGGTNMPISSYLIYPQTFRGGQNLVKIVDSQNLKGANVPCPPAMQALLINPFPHRNKNCMIRVKVEHIDIQIKACEKC